MLSGRPGPIILALPEDVLDLPAADPGGDIRDNAPAPPDPTAVAEIVRRLLAAERPAILAGYGVVRSGAVDALVELSERLAVPVFASWRRPTAFPNDHPNYLGMTGYGSPPSVLKRLAVSDFLLVIGCRLSEVTTFDYQLPAPTTRWAHVDLQPRIAHAGLKPPDLAVATDARAFLKAALVALPAGVAAPAQRVDAVAAEHAAYVAATAFEGGPEWNGPGIDPGRVITTLERVLPSNALLTTDAGNFGSWLARGFHFGRAHGFLGPTSGAMGYGLPAAIAAGLCQPERTVVAVCGDGGFAMTMNELETAVRQGAHPVVLVFDNQRYGTIAMHQGNEGRDYVATDLGPIDFTAVARACGALGVHVTRDADFEPALITALAARLPTVIQLELDRRWISPDRFDG